jgi:hypothetical protein
MSRRSSPVGQTMVRSALFGSVMTASSGTSIQIMSLEPAAFGTPIVTAVLSALLRLCLLRQRRR